MQNAAFANGLQSELILEELHDQMDKILENQKKIFKIIEEDKTTSELEKEQTL